MGSRTAQLIVIVAVAAAVVAAVALMCEDCGNTARQVLRELARAVR